jgi:hypothetical protein
VLWDELEEWLRFIEVDAATSGIWTTPNSPSPKVSVEQKPSDEVMSNVRPSVDLIMLV